jgi:hypothetical protein
MAKLKAYRATKLNVGKLVLAAKFDQLPEDKCVIFIDEDGYATYGSVKYLEEHFEEQAVSEYRVTA